MNLNEGCERWNPFRFSSEYHNDVTGLVDYLYRSYNPIDGRWAQRDPIAEQGGVNLYGFIYNNPTNYTDYCGLEKAATCESEDDIGRYGILKMKPQMYTALDAKWPAGEVELPEINNGFIEYSSTFIKNTFIKRLKEGVAGTKIVSTEVPVQFKIEISYKCCECVNEKYRWLKTYMSESKEYVPFSTAKGTNTQLVQEALKSAKDRIIC